MLALDLGPVLDTAGHSAIDWTAVLLGLFATIPTTITAIAALQIHKVRKAIATPSGDPLGAVAERTHDLAAVTTMHTTQLLRENGVAPDSAPRKREKGPTDAASGLDED